MVDSNSPLVGDNNRVKILEVNRFCCSLLYVQEHDNSHGQDLGASGSCMRRLTTMPYLFCNVYDQCHYASRNDYSYWLTTDISMPMMPISAPGVEPSSRRCAVCEAPGPVVATHSQSTEIPDCLAGWQPIWTGFSFLMVMISLSGCFSFVCKVDRYWKCVRAH